MPLLLLHPLCRFLTNDSIGWWKWKSPGTAKKKKTYQCIQVAERGHHSVEPTNQPETCSAWPPGLPTEDTTRVCWTQAAPPWNNLWEAISASTAKRCGCRAGYLPEIDLRQIFRHHVRMLRHTKTAEQIKSHRASATCLRSTLPNGVAGLRCDVATFMLENEVQTIASNTKKPSGLVFSRTQITSLSVDQWNLWNKFLGCGQNLNQETVDLLGYQDRRHCAGSHAQCHTWCPAAPWPPDHTELIFQHCRPQQTAPHM